MAADILDESFEGTGYEDSANWSEDEGGSSSVDEDYTGVSPPTGGGSQVLRCNSVSDEYARAGWGDGSVHEDTYLTFYHYIDSEDLGNNETATVLWANAGSPGWGICYKIYVVQVSAKLYYRLEMFHDGSSNTYDSAQISLDTWYRIDVKFKPSDDTWEWRIDEVSQDSGSLTSTHEVNAQTFYFGDRWSAMTYDFSYDRIWIDSSEYGYGITDIELVVADALHTHAADAPVLTQAHVLAIAEALHAHSADGIVLTQAHVLAIQEALHSHSSDPIALFQAHQLAMDDALHGHLADNIVLDVGAVVLIVADALHGHSAESPVLTQAHVLAIAEALHSHSADAVDLIQAHILAIADALHAHTSDPIALFQAHQLAMDDALHAHSSDPIALFQAHVLAVVESLHGHLADNITLDVAILLVVADALHSHSAENITLSQVHQLLVESGLHSHLAETIALFQAHTLAVNAGDHTHTVDNIILDIIGAVAKMQSAIAAREDVLLISKKDMIRIGKKDLRLIGQKRPRYITFDEKEN